MDVRQEAKRLFTEEHLSAAQIAERLGIPAGTVRGWKSKERWNTGTLERSDGALRAKPNCYTPFQPRNQVPTVHGLFARYLPDETRDIMQQLQDRSPIDVLWDQIQLAYAALIRSQQIMHVKDIADHSVSKVAEGSSSQGESEKWEIQYAWDKQASYLNALAKAQSALGKMVMQYDELCRSELTTEEQRARIDQIKAATVKLTGGANAFDDAMAQSKTIADMISSPAAERVLSDFLGVGGAADDTVRADEPETE